MTIKNLVSIVEGIVEVYEKGECQSCVGGGDCYHCEHFDEEAFCNAENACSGERWFEEVEHTLFKGVVEEVPYILANRNVISIRAEHIKPYHKPREAYTLIKIEVQGES